METNNELGQPQENGEKFAAKGWKILAFFLTVLATAVGLGAVWRFAYLAEKHDSGII